MTVPATTTPRSTQKRRERVRNHQDATARVDGRGDTLGGAQATLFDDRWIVAVRDPHVGLGRMREDEGTLCAGFVHLGHYS